MREAFFGAGFHDFILRFYAFHVFLLPIAMLGLMVVHFPRFLVFDVPMVMAISGAIMLTGGVFPVGLGLPFEPEVAWSHSSRVVSYWVVCVLANNV